MLGDRIGELRKQFGMSQVELANKIGKSKQSVSNWENNNIQPSIEMLIRLSTIFHVSCDYLLELDDRKFLEVKDLDDAEIQHIQQIIVDLHRRSDSRAE